MTGFLHFQVLFIGIYAGMLLMPHNFCVLISDKASPKIRWSFVNTSIYTSKTDSVVGNEGEVHTYLYSSSAVMSVAQKYTGETLWVCWIFP